MSPLNGHNKGPHKPSTDFNLFGEYGCYDADIKMALHSEAQEGNFSNSLSYIFFN